MGLRCSILGHDYGESTTERDREEKGGEVIVEERELQLCDRCGKEKVLSENTEVRTRQPDPQSSDLDVETPGQDSSEPSFSEPAGTSVSAGGTTTDEPAGGTPAEHAPSADEDDAVILEDDPDEERDPREWPDEAQQEAMSETADPGQPEPEPEPWPEQEGDDEGFDAKPGGDDDAGDVDFSGGLTPESAEPGAAGDEGYVEAPSEPAADASTGDVSGTDGRRDTRPESSSGTSAGSLSGSPPKSSGDRSEPEIESVEDAGFTSAGPVNPPTGSTDDANSVLVCPECGFERRAARASLRAGDICPECKKGYLAERR